MSYSIFDSEYFQRVIERTDRALDASYELSPRYRGNQLAIDWVRTTKCCEESGEVWRALSDATGENHRRGPLNKNEAHAKMLRELGDDAVSALLAIQHHTKDITRTWSIFQEAADKADMRASAFFEKHPELDNPVQLCYTAGMDELNWQLLPAGERLTIGEDEITWTAVDGIGIRYALTLARRLYRQNRNKTWIALGYLL